MPHDAFYVKIIEIFSSVISEIRKKKKKKLKIDFLFYLIQYFKTFLKKKKIFFISFDSMFQDFLSFTHTNKTLCIILIHRLHLLHFYPFIYTYLQPFMSFHVKYTQTKNDVIYLQYFDDTCLTLTLLFHLILIHMS